MPETPPSLGKLVSAYPIAPAFLQRAAFIAVLAFLFFLGMMFAYYMRQSIGYFLLATAFLLLYLVTMFSLVTQKKSVVRIFENGVTYKKFESRWDEIETVTNSPGKKPQIEIRKRDGESTVLPSTIDGLDQIAAYLKNKVAA